MARRHMRQRQERHAEIVLVELVHVERDIEVGREIAVREHHALRRASCAGGVNERGQIVWLNILTESRELGIVFRRSGAQETLHGDCFASAPKRRP